MTRRLGLIGVTLACIGALIALFEGRFLHLMFFMIATVVILVIVGNAENDHHRSS